MYIDVGICVFGLNPDAGKQSGSSIWRTLSWKTSARSKSGRNCLHRKSDCMRK